MISGVKLLNLNIYGRVSPESDSRYISLSEGLDPGLDPKEYLVEEFYSWKGKDRMAECSKETIAVVSTGTRVHQFPKKCGYRFCDICSKSYLAKLYDKAEKGILNYLDFLQTKGVRTVYGRLLTLTMKKSGDINKDVKAIQRYWDLFKKRVKRSGKSLGKGIMAYEIGTRNDNVHLHAYMVGGDYLDYKYISNLWEDVTGDSYIVWISGRLIELNDKKRLKDAVGSGVRYPIKYVGKGLAPKTMSDVVFWLNFKGKSTYRWISRFHFYVWYEKDWKCQWCKEGFWYMSQIILNDEREVPYSSGEYPVCKPPPPGKVDMSEYMVKYEPKESQIPITKDRVSYAV